MKQTEEQFRKSVSDYVRMTELVDTINSDAGTYLRVTAPTLPGFEYDAKIPFCFLFTDTVQGDTFWRELNVKLVEAFPKYWEK